MNNLSKNDFLKLYRNILRCHRILQEPMKSMGDQYVKTEWRLHKKATPKQAIQFYEQWNEYCNLIVSNRDSILKENNDNSGNNNINIGQDLNEKQMKSLNKKQLEQLDKLKSETLTVYTPSD
ncbi:hypothetical protein RB653_002464 [Dictyostelium firmibasis]|uniref:Succinate dehydrogenase assembly factor 3 n=1 Tax=Dictyostelium firmibasis TaxID=79012 RepID=A0AAN7YSP6_9MYCE